jgi:hypothetical protein
MKTMSSSQRQLAIWAGLIGPALFVSVFLLEGALRPGYNPLSTYVSALSLGPRGWIQIVNFILFGGLLLVFAWAVAGVFPSGKASRAGLVLLAILGLCYLASGPLVMDPMGTPLSAATLHGTLHGILGGIVFLCMPISCFVFLRRFRVDPRWQALQAWTLALGTICALAVIVLTLTTKLPALQTVFSDWFGLIQRAAIVPFMLWLFIFALALQRAPAANR